MYIFGEIEAEIWARRKMFKKNNKNIPLIVLLGISFFLSAGKINGSEKKFVISVDKADIHLDPDERSPVIETLDKGEYLTSGSPRKFRKVWNYVYFTSKKNGKTKSGYVHDTVVEKLFRVTQSRELGIAQPNTPELTTTQTNPQSAQWGMSIEQVLELEGKPAVRENSNGIEIIGYQKRVIDKDCLVGYLFADNKLFKTQYNFSENHFDKLMYLDDYEKVKSLVVQRYGEPEGEAVDWKDPQFKNDSNNWGTAISLGHVEYSSRWQTSESEIVLSLFKVQKDVILRIEYSGKMIAD